MAQLLFFDANHKYELDGEPLPSVSELCRFISREIYGDVSQYNLDRAAERGTSVHKATEALDKYGKIDVEDGILPYVQAYIKFRQEHIVDWKKIEFSAHHPTDKYAGTLDRYGTIDGLLAILDIKTSYTIHAPLCSAQLNLYRRMMEANHFQVETLFILHLKNDGKYRLREFPFNDAVPDGLLALHNALKKKARRKKDG